MSILAPNFSQFYYGFQITAEPYNGFWALPGDLVDPKKDLNHSVNEVLFNLTGISDLYFEQVETFGEVQNLQSKSGQFRNSKYFSQF
jgi:ADP-ribose pyrophosphatase YjhB (NUDIX family)